MQLVAQDGAMSVATLNIDPAIERIWRENRCLKRSSIQMYRYRVQHFIDYCRARNLPESTQLTLAGVTAFFKVVCALTEDQVYASVPCRALCIKHMGGGAQDAGRGIAALVAGDRSALGAFAVVARVRRAPP